MHFEFEYEVVHEVVFEFCKVESSDSSVCWIAGVEGKEEEEGEVVKEEVKEAEYELTAGNVVVNEVVYDGV